MSCSCQFPLIPGVQNACPGFLYPPYASRIQISGRNDESCRPDLYALYASKNRLCALCENITPELTAYNAYRNANRRVRRAESTKMYAVGDAYRAHTSEYEHIKRGKERILPSTSSLYCLFLYLLLFAIYSQHLLLPAPSGMYGYHRAIQIAYQASLPVFFNRGWVRS